MAILGDDHPTILDQATTGISKHSITTLYDFAPQPDAKGISAGDGTFSPNPGGLSLVQLNRDLQPFVFFTNEGLEITLHYCSEPELRCYVRCNGEGCTLCQGGKEVQQKLLLPVLDPVSDIVEVLAISKSIRWEKI